ncbi:hypothetical protein R3X27_07690 [Tropicimonas sp. TH_r6]|nr:hypothetical protein [Tropicimonas sp. TH_r6]
MMRKSIPAHTVGVPTFEATLRAVFSALPNPATYLRAYQDMRRFKSMDVAVMRDTGLCQADIDTTTFGDFLKQPRR